MFHLIIGFIYFVRLWSSWRVGGVPLGRGPSSLGYFALYPWVVVGVSLGTSCLLLACLLFAPCLPRRKNASLQGGGLFRVSRLGRYIGWAAFLGRLVMVFFGGDGHSSSQGKSPGAAHMSAPGCLVVCCSICQACRLSLLFRLWRRSVPRLHRRDSLFAAVCRDAFSRLGQLACGWSTHP